MDRVVSNASDQLVKAVLGKRPFPLEALVFIIIIGMAVQLHLL